MFSAAQLRVFLSALITLDPYDFAEDVAAFYSEDDEKRQQTPGEVLLSTLIVLPDDKLTQFALRLVSTGHTDTPRENDFDFLAQAAAAFEPLKPKAAKAKTAQSSKVRPAVGKANPKKEAA